MRRRVKILSLALCMAAVTVQGAFAQSGIEMGKFNPKFEEYLESQKKVQLQESDDAEYGYMPLPVMIAPRQHERVEKSQVFPEKFDLRDQGGVTPVKNQGGRGTCWTFGAMGTIESYFKYVKGNEYDFSEMNLANNNGFDSQDGGHALKSIAYLSRGDGLVYEEDDPYDDQRYFSPSGLERRALVSDMEMIPHDMSSIKSALMNVGAVQAGMNAGASFFDAQTASYYAHGVNDADHDIIIVGWNDSYLASNFKEEPPGDGAWICKNSWGEEWGEDGFFYISYYDTVVAKNEYYDEIANTNWDTDILTYKADNDSEYNEIYQHDYLGCTRNCGYSSEQAYFANVFECENAVDTIAAAGLYTLGYDSEYEIYIVPNYGSPSDLAANRELVAKGTIENAGYHTVEFDSEVQAVSGEKFAIVVKLTTPGQDSPVAIEQKIDGYSSEAQANEGESFVSAEGEQWEDSSKDGGFNVCLKAYAKSEDAAVDESASYFAHGVSLFNAEDYENALEIFDLAIEKNPGKGMYYFYKGKCLQELGMNETAIEAYDEGISQGDDYLEMLCIADGELLMSMEDYEKAIGCFEKVTSVRNRESALHSKAVCLWNLERFEEASAAFDELLHLSSDYLYQYTMDYAQCMFDSKSYEDCIRLCDEAVESNSISIKAPRLKANALYELGMHEQVVDCVEELESVYNENWAQAKNEEVERMMSEAYAVKADSLLELSNIGEALSAVEDSKAHGECERADNAKAAITGVLGGYTEISGSKAKVESDHVFTVEFSKKADYDTLNGNILVVDSSGNLVGTQSQIYGAWYSAKVYSSEPYAPGSYCIYVVPAIKGIEGETLSKGVKLEFQVE